MSSMLWTALLVALAVGSVMSSISSSELDDIIRRLEAAEAEITALKENKEVQEKEITDMKSLISQVREILLNISIFSAMLGLAIHIFSRKDDDHQYLTSLLTKLCGSVYSPRFFILHTFVSRCFTFKHIW